MSRKYSLEIDTGFILKWGYRPLLGSFRGCRIIPSVFGLMRTVGQKLVGGTFRFHLIWVAEASCGPLGCFGPLYKRYSTLVMIVGQCGLSMVYVQDFEQFGV